MKAILPIASLRSNLSRLMKLPGVSQTNPGHMCVRIKADMEGCYLSRHSGNAMIGLEVDGEVEDDGEIHVSIHHLSDIASKFKGEALTLEEDDEHIIARCGKQVANLKKIRESELAPEVGMLEGEIMEYTVTPAQFLPALRRASTCINRDTEDALSSVKIACNAQGRMEVVGTDRKRFFKSVTTDDAGNIDLLIADEIVQAILTLLDGWPNPFTLASSGGRIAISMDHGKAVFTQSEGKFPDYTLFFEKLEGAKVVGTIAAGREELLEAVRTAGHWGSEGSMRVIVCQPHKSKLVIVGDNRADATVNDEITAKCKGEPFAVNSGWLANALGELKQDDVTITHAECGGQMIYVEEDGVIAAMALCKLPEAHKEEAK